MDACSQVGGRRDADVDVRKAKAEAADDKAAKAELVRKAVVSAVNQNSELERWSFVDHRKMSYHCAPTFTAEQASELICSHSDRMFVAMEVFASIWLAGALMVANVRLEDITRGEASDDEAPRGWARPIITLVMALLAPDVFVAILLLYLLFSLGASASAWWLAGRISAVKRKVVVTFDYASRYPARITDVGLGLTAEILDVRSDAYRHTELTRPDPLYCDAIFTDRTRYFRRPLAALWKRNGHRILRGGSVEHDYDLVDEVRTVRKRVFSYQLHCQLVSTVGLLSCRSMDSAKQAIVQGIARFTGVNVSVHGNEDHAIYSGNYAVALAWWLSRAERDSTLPLPQ